MLIRFDRVILFVLVLVGLSVTVTGQIAATPAKGQRLVVATSPCELTLSLLPPFFGVRFGASYDDVRAVYPEIEKDKHFQERFAEPDALALFMAESFKLSNKSSLEGALQLNVSFQQKVVTTISAHFRADKWSAVTEAIGEYSKTLGIPETSWAIYNDDAGILQCKDFRFHVGSQAHPDQRLNQMSIIPEPVDGKESPYRPVRISPIPPQKPTDF